MKLEDEQVVCPKSHKMGKASGIPAEYELLGTPVCDICRKSDLQDHDYFFHCKTCQYDLCKKCSATPKLIDQSGESESESSEDQEIAFDLAESQQYGIAESRSNGAARSQKVKTVKVDKVPNKDGGKGGSFDRKTAKKLRDKKQMNYQK
jgi:hypothetical protein